MCVPSLRTLSNRNFCNASRFLTAVGLILAGGRRGRGRRRTGAGRGLASSGAVKRTLKYDRHSGQTSINCKGLAILFAWPIVPFELVSFPHLAACFEQGTHARRCTCPPPMNVRRPRAFDKTYKMRRARSLRPRGSHASALVPRRYRIARTAAVLGGLRGPCYRRPR